MLHPFMPFITEEIWNFLPKGEAKADNPDQFLIKESWPIYDEAFKYPEEVARLDMTMAAVRSIRNIRAEAEAAPSRKMRAVILSKGKEKERIKAAERYIKNLANVTEIVFTEDKNEIPDEVTSSVIHGAEIYIPMDDLVDYNAEFERLTKEKSRLEGEVKRITGKLQNEGFVSKAPEKIINEEKQKLAKYEEMLTKIMTRLPIVEKKLS